MRVAAWRPQNLTDRSFYVAFPDDDCLARDLAVAAGERLLKLRASGMTVDDLRRAGDLGSHEYLATELARVRPHDAVLSEEAVDDPARLAAERVWIIDPLDGTREFGEEGRTDWAVHVGLWERSSLAPLRLAAAAVALPAQGRVLGSDVAGGYPHMPAQGGPLRFVASRTRPPALLTGVAADLGAELVP